MHATIISELIRFSIALTLAHLYFLGIRFWKFKGWVSVSRPSPALVILVAAPLQLHS